MDAERDGAGFKFDIPVRGDEGRSAGITLRDAVTCASYASQA
jgi:hypothetical protein